MQETVQSFIIGNWSSLLTRVSLRLAARGLCGPLPVVLGELIELEELDLSSNDLEGHIPPELGKLLKLKELCLQCNMRLTGTLPKELGNLLQLEVLDLSNNNLQGTIPPEIGKLVRLKMLSLHENTGLTGPLPKELGGLLELKELRLSHCNFEGQIPPELGNLRKLKTLALFGNLLRGPIPVELANIQTLQKCSFGKIGDKIDLLPWEFGWLQRLSLVQGVTVSQLRARWEDRPNSRLHGAAWNGRLEAVRTLLRCGEHPDGPKRLPVFWLPAVQGDVCSSGGYEGESPLTLACRRGHVDVIRLLVNEGADVNLAERTGATPILLASFWGNDEIVSTLISSGAKVSSAAERVGCREYATLAALKGVRSEECVGMTALMWSSVKAYEDIVTQILAAEPGEVNVQDGLGRAALHWACKAEGANDGVLSHLLLKGADVTLRDCRQNTCLHLACGSGDLFGYAAHLLLQHNAAIIDLQNDQMETALLIACRRADVHLVHVLLEAGATVELAAEDGKTPMDIARELGAEDIVAELIQAIELADEARSQEEARNAVTEAQVEARIAAAVGEAIRKAGVALTEAVAEAKARERSRAGVALQAAIQRVRQEEDVRLRVAVEAAVQRAREEEKAQGLTALENVLRDREELENLLLERDEEIAELRAQLESALTVSAPAQQPQHRLYDAQQLEDACEGFHVSRLLGRGSFGAVYRGTISGDGDGDDMVEVAVKKLDDNSIQGVERFRREVFFLMMCLHPNVLPLLGICLQSVCLVYPLMLGGSLDSHLLSEERRTDLSCARRIGIALGIARALQYLHEPLDTKPAVVHRDVKPHNILLEHPTGSGADGRGVRLGDVGIARVVDMEGEAMMATNLNGSFLYIDPNFLVTGQVDAVHDVFSFGVVLLELILGRMMMPGLVLRMRQFFSSASAGSAALDGLILSVADSAIAWSGNSLRTLAETFLACTDPVLSRRASLSALVTQLEAVAGAAPAQQQQQNAPRSRECVICMQALITTRVRPCLHSVACVACATHMLTQRMRCPICRTAIAEVEEGDYAGTFG